MLSTFLNEWSFLIMPTLTLWSRVIHIFSLSFITSFLPLLWHFPAEKISYLFLAAALNPWHQFKPSSCPTLLHENFLTIQSSSFQGLHTQSGRLFTAQEQPAEGMSRGWDQPTVYLPSHGPWCRAVLAEGGEGGHVLICTKLSEGLQDYMHLSLSWTTI